MTALGLGGITLHESLALISLAARRIRAELAGPGVVVAAADAGKR
jgi:hypothetical protein